MKITIGPYFGATRTVDVVFEQGDIRHERAVNACHDAGGAYDEAATRARVDDVARGVAQKILVGAITAQPDANEPAPLVDQAAA